MIDVLCLVHTGHICTSPIYARDKPVRILTPYEDCNLEDWMNVIWSNETSVVLGYCLGGYCVWRQPEERFFRSIIRPWWKGYSEFMFWGSFLYYRKGPCHIWTSETIQQRATATADLIRINAELESIARAEWELTTAMRRTGIRNLTGKKPTWKWDKRHSELVRGDGKGVDWYCYATFILTPKLIPFA